MATRSKEKKTVSANLKRKQPSAVQALRDDVMSLKRDRILYEAGELFYQRGYLQSTVNELAERLGATKPFVYYHFQSKADLLIEICQRGTSDALAATEKALSMGGSPTQRFEALMREFTRVALKNHQFVAIYFREEFNLPQAATERINAMRKTINARLRSLLAEGVASGDFEIGDPGMSALVIAGMSSYAFAWYRDKGRLDLEHVTEHIVQMALKLVRKPGQAPEPSSAQTATDA
ncbi:MAG: TetR/AcrR family transcriptional regulator [Comamonadaceae bacterium]|jgi:AcrR family transcriptional regulator|nr:TetR/AcrR family transcriptional regulator [Comamonadaceae bacterium]